MYRIYVLFHVLLVLSRYQIHKFILSQDTLHLIKATCQKPVVYLASHDYIHKIYFAFESECNVWSKLIFSIIFFVHNFPGCPFSSIPYNGACYGVHTFTNAVTQAPYTAAAGFPYALSFCENLSPAGKLILPKIAAENEFIQKLAKSTE